jgi:hypothetical protein
MRVISFSSLCLTILILCGCGNGGGQVGPYFAYNGPPQTTPLQPGETTPIDLTFSIVNLSNVEFVNLPWLIYADGNPNDVIASGTISEIDAGANANVTVGLSAPVNPGAHQLTVVIDPDNNLGETDVSQNYIDVIVTWANLDLLISGTPTVAQTGLTGTDPLTVTFDIENLDTSGNEEDVNSVSYEIMEGTTVLTTGTAGPIDFNTTLPVSVTLPAASIGEHVYTIIINYDDAVIEQDVDNDSTEVDFTVQPSGTT